MRTHIRIYFKDGTECDHYGERVRVREYVLSFIIENGKRIYFPLGDIKYFTVSDESFPVMEEKEET